MPEKNTCAAGFECRKKLPSPLSYEYSIPYSFSIILLYNIIAKYIANLIVLIVIMIPKHDIKQI